MNELNTNEIRQAQRDLKSRAYELAALKNRVWDNIAEIEFETNASKGGIRCSCMCHSNKFKYSQEMFQSVICAECGNEITLE